MKKETIAILDKLPSSCIALDNKKKVVYFNKFAKKQFFSLKKNIKIENFFIINILLGLYFFLACILCECQQSLDNFYKFYQAHR